MFKVLNIKMAFTYNIQSVVHCKIHQHSTLYLSKQKSTQTECYTIGACFQFEPLEKFKTFKDIFPRLSRSKVIFQHFPSPGIFKKKTPGLSMRHGDHERCSCMFRIGSVMLSNATYSWVVRDD